MVDEICAGQHRHDQAHAAFLLRLAVRDLGRSQAADGMKRHPQPARQLPGGEHGLRRLGHAEGRRSRLHRHRGGETAHQARRAGTNQLRQRAGGERLGQQLRQRAGLGAGAHGAGNHPRRAGHRLVVTRVNLERARHGVVHHQRRVGVRDPVKHRVAIDEVVTEQDLHHRHRILGALGADQCTEQRPIAVSDMRQHHVEVALVDRQIDRFADDAAAVMQMRDHLVNLVELDEIVERGIASSLVDIVHEGGTVNRAQHGVAAADLDVVFRIARVLGILPRRRRLDDPAAHAGLEAHPLAVDIGAGVPEIRQDFRVVVKFHAGVAQNAVGILLDQAQAFFAQNIESSDISPDIGRSRRDLRPGLSAGSALAPAGRSVCCCHWGTCR